jgi:hypothetical protein
MSVPLPSCSMRLSFAEQVLRQYLEARTERDRTRRLSVAPPGLLAGAGEAEEAPSRDAALPVVWGEVLLRSAGVAV